MLMQDIDLTREDRIGAGGIPVATLDRAIRDMAPALKRLKAQAKDGALPLLAVPGQRDDLAGIKAAARVLRKGASDVVFLGTGGSSLGAQALGQLADLGVPGLALLRGKPRVHFIDNLDPVSFERLLALLPLPRTRFVAVSKSGGTGETLMQTMAAIAAMRQAGLSDMEIGQRFMGLSEPTKPSKVNALRALLEPFGVPFLDHHTGVGGRYSVLTNVGLLPAAVLGLDIGALRKGAKAALAATLKARAVPDSAAALGAAVNLAAMRAGKGNAVMMGYGDRFERLSKWWVQLWAESLGKDGQGTQPVAALGPVDQHSQQQLYLGGPRDKLFTVITQSLKGLGPRMEAKLAAAAHEKDFAGKTIGDLVAAQGLAMIDTFARNGCAVRRIHLETLDEASYGGLLMHFMLETILTGYAMGIDPFDQPAVEEAKILAKRYLAEGKGR